MTQPSPKKMSSHRGAFWVGAGIFLSRIFGLIRMRVLAHFLGDSNPADAFYAAVKIPNFLQNLLGEGVLSASFIPVYADLISKGDKELSQKLANVIFSLLAVLVSVLVVLGILGAPFLVSALTPGFTGEKQELTVLLVRIIFPGTGFLVLSALCLGILNSHHRFFMSYVAPVFSNLAVIAVLIFYRSEPEQAMMAQYAAWGLLLGSFLQLAVQLPLTFRFSPRLRFDFSTSFQPVRIVVLNFFPVVFGRGVVQVSAYIDNILASFLPGGAIAAIGYAQTIYMLPISLFGMSISAAELPGMSQAFGRDDLHQVLRERINSALKRMAFFVIPTVVGFLALGDSIVALLFQTGQFDQSTTMYVWSVLAGYTIGIFASTRGRLYSSAYYSLRDTRTPLKISLLRVSLAAILGVVLGLLLPGWIQIDASFGTAGLATAAGLSSWVEFSLLRRGLNRRIGPTGLPIRYALKLWGVATLSAIFALTLKHHFGFQNPLLLLAVYGLGNSFLFAGRSAKNQG